MSLRKILVETLHALYEAPLDPSSWTRFLELAAFASKGQAATLLMHNFGNAESAMSFDWGFHPDVARLYAAHYGEIDVWRSAVTKSSNWVGVSEHFVPRAELLKTEFYNDLLLPYEIPHGMFAMVERGPTLVANLSVCRGMRAGAFTKRDLDVLGFLQPHIQRAYRLHVELGRAQARNREMMAVLDEIASGVILIGGNMRVLAMNRAAERTMASNNGLRCAGGRLRLEGTRENLKLESLLLEAQATSDGKGLKAAGQTIASRRDLPPLQLLVSPAHGFRINSADSVRALVFITDPAERIGRKADWLRSAFGLTAAEGRLAAALAEGNTLSEIAAVLGLTRNTLKSQLAAIYRKTETSRQSQVVALLGRISLP